MFKRLLWLTIGASFGFGLSFWLTRMIKQTMERYAPQRVSADLTSALRQFGQDLKDAAAEGRDAMREHEAALRADLADHGTLPLADGQQPRRPARLPRSRLAGSRATGQITTDRPDGTRQRPLRATGRLRVAERQEASR